ncbi:Receptor kinase-like protein Xa21 [Vitis vinifera]|uniref:non-specific serine/threonine protein kinase n=1 Tax=Vitis vinifera TaxID=29760 RepID=A0A438C6N5_VITVI|nr:Receptor kinase-like protein Xa21 [Vitis vinifera]
MNHLQNLKLLSFPMNNLTGQCIKLQVISLAYNDFTGSIPSGIGNLVELQFTGGIPQAIGSLSNLEGLCLGYNKLTGGIPRKIGNLSNLNILHLASSGIGGPIPAEIFNISSLQAIDFSNNSLYGCLPMDICKHLPNLQWLYLHQSHLSGQLPTTLSLCGELLFLTLSFNKFRGSIPREIGNLSKLEGIYLYDNSLVGSIPNSFGNLKALKFLQLGINNLIRMVPEAIFNISKLQSLAMGQNHFLGSLPSSIGTWLLDLEELLIGDNEFSGTIPMSISNMSKLTQLDVSHNSFIGNVPKDLSNLTKLESLNLAYNQLTDEHLTSGVGFLTSLTTCKFFRTLSIGYNPLKGTLPNSLGNLPIALESFTASACQFRGTIPTGIGYLLLSSNKPFGSILSCFGDLHALQWLTLDSNVLALNIPSCLWSLKDLLFFNLSSNFLTGNLPPEVGNMKSMIALDLSKNLVSGEVPDGGPFVNFTAESFIFNKALCGAPHFQVIACDKNTCSQSWKTKRDNMEIPAPIDSWLPGTHEKISHQQLLYATTTLMKTISLGKEARACDAKDSPPKSCQDNYLLLKPRFQSVDVASTLEYLHHDCSSLVVHHDLKPSNVLLDDDMVAHVADFGIARLLIETEPMQQTKTLGTIGYMAPEHGSDGMVSTKSNVYSYGILLMEVFARKKPMDEMFTGDLTLKTWVESLSNSVIQVVDANLLRREDEDLATKLSCLSSIMALALACTTDSLEERIHMKNVVVELKNIRIKLLI